MLRSGDLTIDLAEHRCRRGETAIDLTPKEFALASYLLLRHGEVTSKQELLRHVWDDVDGFDTNVVEVYVGYLRRKIDMPFGRAPIETVRGVGYRLVDDAC